MATRSRTHPSRRTAAAADDPPRASGTGQLPLVLSAIALAVAGLGLWVAFASSGGSGCQSRAWDSLPDDRDLPAGWTVATSNYFVGNLTTTLAGPLSAETEQAGQIFATVSCLDGDATEGLARSRAADHVVGNPTVELEGIGEDGYEIIDEFGAVAAIHFRRGDLVAYIQGDATEEDMRAAARVFDQAMQAARAGVIPSPGPLRSFDPVSFDPSLDPGAESLPPESLEPSAQPSGVETALPSEVAGTPFVTEVIDPEDLTGSPSGRALIARVRALGHDTADLEVAQAFDENGELELYFLGFELPGAESSVVRTILLESWLVATAEGVTVDEVELGGKTVTRIEYGEGVPPAYLYERDGIFVVIQSGDEEVAEAGAEALP